VWTRPSPLVGGGGCELADRVGTGCSGLGDQSTAYPRLTTGALHLWAIVVIGVIAEGVAVAGAAGGEIWATFFEPASLFAIRDHRFLSTASHHPATALAIRFVGCCSLSQANVVEGPGG